MLVMQHSYDRFRRDRTTDGNSQALIWSVKTPALKAYSLKPQFPHSLKKHTMMMLDMEVATMLKACGWCGRMHDINASCPRKPTQVGRKYPSKTDADKLRNTYRWRHKREQIKADAHYMCEVCADQGRITNKHLEVHHITKLNQAPDLLTDDDNLICLCVTHHKQADADELDQNYLKQLARKRHT